MLPGPAAYPEYRLNGWQGWDHHGDFLETLKTEIFSCQKLIDDSMVIGPTALPSCIASSHPRSTLQLEVTLGFQPS